MADGSSVKEKEENTKQREVGEGINIYIGKFLPTGYSMRKNKDFLRKGSYQH